MFNKKLTKNYYDFLPVFMKDYNNTIDSSTKETPYKLYYGEGLSSETKRINQPDKVRFKIGDYVRLSKVKRTFEKGYTEKWTHEAFKIIDID